MTFSCLAFRTQTVSVTVDKFLGDAFIEPVILNIGTNPVTDEVKIPCKNLSFEIVPFFLLLGHHHRLLLKVIFGIQKLCRRGQVVILGRAVCPPLTDADPHPNWPN